MGFSAGLALDPARQSGEQTNSHSLAKTCSLQKVPLLLLLSPCGDCPPPLEQKSPELCDRPSTWTMCAHLPDAVLLSRGRKNAHKHSWCRAMRPGVLHTNCTVWYGMGWVSVALGWWPFADPSPAALPKGPQRPPEALLIERRSAVARYLPKYASPLVPLVPLVPRLVDRLIFPSGERRFSFSILHASRSVCTTRPLQLIGNPRLRRTSRPNMVKQNDKDESKKTKEKRIPC